jgi:integrase
MKVISEQLGHSSIKITMDIYGSLPRRRAQAQWELAEHAAEDVVARLLTWSPHRGLGQ